MYPPILPSHAIHDLLHARRVIGTVGDDRTPHDPFATTSSTAVGGNEEANTGPAAKQLQADAVTRPGSPIGMGPDARVDNSAAVPADLVPAKIDFPN
jgi:hypothetical protein